jgi:hypothetical protein
MPDASSTIAASASAVCALLSGLAQAAPLSPDADEPVVEVDESPLAALACEVAPLFALPEVPPSPVLPESEYAEAAPGAPLPPPLPLAPVVELSGSVDAPVAPLVPPAPVFAVEVAFEPEFDAPELPPVLVFVVVALPVLPVVAEPVEVEDELPV